MTNHATGTPTAQTVPKPSEPSAGPHQGSIDALLLRWYDADTNGSAVTHYAMHDAQFNITGLIASDGNVVERYEYDAYGQRTVLDADFSEDADNISDFDFQFGHQGLMHDRETGLIHNRNRMRHPTLGRFIQRDPLGYVDGMNRFTPYHVVHGDFEPLLTGCSVVCYC